MGVEDVLKFFEDFAGPIDDASFGELVGADLPIQIRLIRPNDKCQCFTLFTIGMSAIEMNTSEDGLDYQFGELFIQLPPDWKFTPRALEEPNYTWPISWLKRIARFPHESGISIGPVAVLANSSQIDYFSPNNQFTGMLVLSESTVERSEGNGIIQMYRLLPLFWREVLVEEHEGIATLLNLLDKRDVSFVVDVNRESVA